MSAGASSPRLLADAPQKPKEPTRAPRPRARGPRIPQQGEDAEARRLCAAILEVLGGARTPTQAAEALGISLPRYYALESRALGGLLEACRKRQRGPARTPEREVSKLKSEVDRLKRECTRSQALLRSTQRTVGLSPPEAPKCTPGAKRRRRRRPTARALRAAKTLSEPLRNSMEPVAAKPEDLAEVK